MPEALSQALVNGAIVPLIEALLPLTHPIFLTSFGVYESVQVDRGRPFHLRGHLERLYNSAGLLQMVIPQQLNTLLKWGQMLVEALPPISYALQILVLGQDVARTELVIAFLPRPLSLYSPQFYSRGASVITYQGRRDVPQSKSMNTLVNHLARTAARTEGALEALLVHNNHFTEGSRSNLFIVEAQSDRLLTPPAETVLPGVTREIVIKLMKRTPYPVQQARIATDAPITEMFITSTSMHVMPITALNGQPIGDGSVGPITKAAMARFKTYFRGYFS